MEKASAPRPLRADAERNRRAILDAAEAVFGEHGLDVGVAEIAARAGVGRGTLFRNFASKEDLIAAIVSDRMADTAARARELLASDRDDALFELITEMVARSRTSRTLFEAVQDTFLQNTEIAAAYDVLMGALEELLQRGQAAGVIRKDVVAVDVILLIKGICEASVAMGHIGDQVAERQTDLVRAALRAGQGITPLRGEPPTMDDLERAHASPGPDTSPAQAS
jgi:AcrR family transcriptional regulator